MGPDVLGTSKKAKHFQCFDKDGSDTLLSLTGNHVTRKLLSKRYLQLNFVSDLIPNLCNCPLCLTS